METQQIIKRIEVLEGEIEHLQLWIRETPNVSLQIIDQKSIAIREKQASINELKALLKQP